MVSSTQRATDDAVTSLLENPRYELMPFSSFDDQLAELPDGSTVTITASPQLGLEETIDATERAADRGYEVVPHVAARYVEGPDHLAEVCERLVDAGVTDIFVPGGDPEDPAGEFESAHDLLVALDDLEYEFDEVGITGYPEGHAFIDDETLAEEMKKKAPHATYITTQICYDPETVIDWIETIREERDVDLPVEVGIPGVMKYQKLLSISKEVGVGQSLSFLKKTSGILGFIKQFIGSRGKYRPDELVDGIAAYADNPEYDVRGLHVYTFNQVPDTESWRKNRLRKA